MRGVAFATLAAAVLASTASAADRIGTARSDTLRGTARSDFLDPREGRDRVIAGSGGDRIKAFDGFFDDIRCGPHLDVVAADLRDRVRADCEVVSRRLAVDPLRTPGFVHGTHVEPDSFSFRQTLVTVYQVGRAPRQRGGAAAANGFSTTRDGGRTWRSGLLPGLTQNTRPAGRWERSSDPVIAYDARHGAWLASSLVVSPERESGLTVNRSSDGIRWGNPIVTTETRGDLSVDKQWLTCDNWPESPFYGRCYHAYTDIVRDRISVQTSADGGLTWSAPVGSPDNAGGENRVDSPGVQPVVRPDGALLVIYFNETRVSLIRSTDGGATFSRRQFVAPASGVVTPRFRAFSLPVAEVGPTGTVYVSWMDCGLRNACNDAGSDLMLVSSADGVNWSPPSRIGTGPATSGTYYALPGLAVNPARPRQLALAYYRVRGEAIDAYFVSSNDEGARWSAPRRLSPQSMSRSWMPDTQYGPMLADYISTSFVNGRPIPIVVLAGQPRGAQLQQSVFAALVR